MRQENITLSICIPTHNRGNFLSKTLESIVCQHKEAVEIVILDSASTDNTRDVISEYQKRNLVITYYYQEPKMGIDVDMSKVVELARGEYCWLMSDDDALAPGSIQILLEEINKGYDVYICNRVVCDLSLHPIKERTWLVNSIEKQVFDLSNREDLLYYFDSSIEFGAIFSYMSVLIFKRKEWNSVGYDEEFTGGGYSHAMRIFKILMQRGGRLKYIPAPLVLNRSFNDSFLKNGFIKRFMIDIDGYSLLAERLFHKDDILKKKFLKIMMLERPWYQITKLRAFIDNTEYWEDVRNKLLRCGYSRAVVNFSSILGNLRSLVKFSVKLRQIYNLCPLHSWGYSFRKRFKKLIHKNE